MNQILRITDKYHIKDRGTVYIIKDIFGCHLKTGDLLFDLRGNRFRIEGIEMLRKSPEFDFKVNENVGILLEELSGVGVQGNILVTENVTLNFLFCDHPMYHDRVDPDYEEEYMAAESGYPCALVSYEDMETGKLSLYGEEISGLTIYRGWMMKPDVYRKMYELLEQKNIYLINTPENYERYHLLPGWYDEFKEYTPESVWTVGDNIDDVKRAAASLEGACIVKDYVKSRKHEWYDACFIRDIRDEKEIERVVGNFISRQGDGLVGGVVLRRFEELNQIGFHGQSGMPLSEEYRVFIFAGKVLAIDDYWAEGSGVKLSEEEYRWVESIAAKVKSSFVTLDLARKKDGSLIIMEFGDGQVSGLQQLDSGKFYGEFKRVFKCLAR